MNALQTNSTVASGPEVGGAVGWFGSDVSHGPLVPRVPIYYDRQFIFTFTNASSFSLAPLTSPTLGGWPNAFSIPQCSHITWENTCIPGEETVPLILMVVPIGSDTYATDDEKELNRFMQPTRYLSSFRCAEGANWDADLPVGQRVLFGFFDAHGHYGGLTKNPYVITGQTSALTNTNDVSRPANASGSSTNTSSPCKMATEISTPIELVLNPPSNPCNYVMLQIKGGRAPYTLTVLNPDKGTWADISVDTTSTVLLTNISDPGSSIIMFVVDKNLVRSEVTGEYNLGHAGTCNHTVDRLLASALDDSSSKFSTRRQLHLEMIIPMALLGLICLVLFVFAIRGRNSLAQRVARWRRVTGRRGSSLMGERVLTGSVTIINPDGPSSCSLPSKCAPEHSNSDVPLSCVEMTSNHGHGHTHEHGSFSTVIALAGSFDPRTTTLDKLSVRLPHVLSKSRHLTTSSRNYNAADGSVELMQLASPGSGLEAGGPDSPDRSTSLGHAHRSSIPKLLILTDSALMLENARGGSDGEKTPTTVGLADPNEFVYRNAGWHLSTNRNTSASQVTAAVAASAPVPPLPVLSTIRPDTVTAASCGVTAIAQKKLNYADFDAVSTV